MVQFLKKLPELGDFGDAICNSTIFRFCALSGDGGLTLGRPRNKATVKEDDVTGGGAASVRASSPINISVNHKLTGSSAGNDKPEV
jgi:hypothetical protein